MQLVNPANNLPLRRLDNNYYDADGNKFPIVNEIPRFAASNYTDSFGFQWNKFRETQLDNGRINLSESRFFGQTAWTAGNLDGLDLLEVGSGAGRFSKVVLEKTKANLWSLDYSNAVDANFKNNGEIDPDRFNLIQASIYEMPFHDNIFDKVFCFGVLQHTPDFEASVESLVKKTKIGGEIVVDFYAISGWWTKIHSKYILRPLTKKMEHERLFRLIENNVDWLMNSYDMFQKYGLGVINRFLPITDIKLFPHNISKAERREWAIMDTFDAFSPEFDQPQRPRDVVRMFERSGAHVTFSGTVEYEGGSGTVVRAVKRWPSDL